MGYKKRKRERQERPNWRKIFWLCALVAVVAYAYGEPYLEQWIGVDLPSIRETGDVAVLDQPEKSTESRDRAERSRSHSPPQAEQPLPSSSTRKSDRELIAEQEPVSSTKPFLVETGKKQGLRSPAGLIYRMGPGGEHRVDHVMRHASDDPSRPVHGVFDGDRQQILEVLDEAYELVLDKSKRVQTKRDDRLDFRLRHLVDMGKRIGYLGGKSGRRKNNPPLKKITLVIDNGKFMVTAYPDR